MGELDPQSIVAAIVETEPTTRELLAGALRQAGVRELHVYGDVAAFRRDVPKAPLDLIILDAGCSGVFALLNDMRHLRVGANPFAIIVTLVTGDQAAGVALALAAGTDDVLTRPVKEASLMARLRRGGPGRLPFVVTSDYLGPDRRAKDRPAALPRLGVPNSLAEKIGGRAGGVAGELILEVMRRRRAAHGYRIAMLSRLLSDGNAQPLLAQIVALLGDSANLSDRLGEPEIALICRILAARAVASSHAPVDIIAFAAEMAEGLVPALRPGHPAQELRDSAVRAAETCRSLPIQEVLRFGPAAEGMIASNAEGVSVSPLAKGAVLFREGSPSDAAYVATSGSLALYREPGGTPHVVAKILHGEMLGEMTAADGAPRRLTAVALEDSTVAAFPADLLHSKLAAADPLLRGLVAALQRSLVIVHDIYAPRSRHIADSVLQMGQQVAAIRGYLHAPSASAGMKAEADAIAAKLADLTDELVALIAAHPELDRRARVIPAGGDLEAGKASG